MTLRVRILYVCVFVFALMSASPAQDPVFIPNDPAPAEFRYTAEEIKGVVHDILQGVSRPSVKSTILPAAMLIDGGSQSDLSESLFGNKKSTAFTREKDPKVTIEQLWISPELTSAYLITEIRSKTKEESRFHSVFFMKDKKGDWKIKHWHTSR